MTVQRSEQELVRIGKLDALRERGYPFPNDAKVTALASGVKDATEKFPDSDTTKLPVMTIGGRMMAIRLMGKAAFCQVQDRSGIVQIYVKRDEIGEEAFAAFKDYDLGDIIEATGYPFKTKTGEPSLHVSQVRLLVKCLHPLPEKWHGLTDVEVRYRQRYVDLMTNDEVRDIFRKRAQVISLIRRFFDNRGYLEVETPMMHQVVGGATAKPFLTHHNALDLDLNMRIALELHLKRLVVGGLDRVYEIGRVFRNEGLSTQHNPEFTMIEFYEAYATYETLMDLTEELLAMLCQEVRGKLTVQVEGKEVSFARPWRRLTMIDALHDLGGVPRTLDLLTDVGVRKAATHLQIALTEEHTDYGVALYHLFDQAVEDHVDQPTFITRFPLAVSPLARPSLDDERFTDRFELFIAGMEVANAFSELNDPQDQHRRFLEQLKAKQQGDEEAMDMDEDFVRALEYGMPPTAGEGIGIDRLVMILTEQPSIRDVILFPQMRPLGGAGQ